MARELNSGNRPYVILNAAMSLDGKIATVSGDSEFSSEEDWRRVHKLRSEMDAIMVGINTILKDDPKLYVKYYPTTKFLRIIIDSKARTPPSAKIFQMDPSIYPVLIAVTENAPKSNIRQLKQKGAQVFLAGNGEKVDLNKVMQYLWRLNIRRILLEGGGTLNFSMLQEKLVDEVIIAIAPVLVGGKNAISLVEGEGVNLVEEGAQLEFNKYERLGKNIVLYFKVKK